MQTFLLLSKSQTPPGQTEITLVTRKFTLRLFLLTSINITTPSVEKKKKSLRAGITLGRETKIKIKGKTQIL